MALQRGYNPTARRYNIVPQHVRHQGRRIEKESQRRTTLAFLFSRELRILIRIFY